MATRMFFSDILSEEHYDVYARFYGHAQVIANASVENPPNAYAEVDFTAESYVEVIELGYEMCFSL